MNALLIFPSLAVCYSPCFPAVQEYGHDDGLEDPQHGLCLLFCQSAEGCFCDSVPFHLFIIPVIIHTVSLSTLSDALISQGPQSLGTHAQPCIPFTVLFYDITKHKVQYCPFLSSNARACSCRRFISVPSLTLVIETGVSVIPLYSRVPTFCYASDQSRTQSPQA